MYACHAVDLSSVIVVRIALTHCEAQIAISDLSAILPVLNRIGVQKATASDSRHHSQHGREICKSVRNKRGVHFMYVCHAAGETPDHIEPFPLHRFDDQESDLRVSSSSLLYSILRPAEQSCHFQPSDRNFRSCQVFLSPMLLHCSNSGS
jgi:hypothetical protein